MFRKREVFGAFTLSWFVVEGHFCHLQLSTSKCLIMRDLCIRCGTLYKIASTLNVSLLLSFIFIILMCSFFWWRF